MRRHQPFYCEENVWHLCQEPDLAGRGPQVVFISNANQSIAMWCQRAARRAGAPILWDYHVVVLVRAPREVWDLDSTLGLPVDALTYLRQSFRPDLPAELMPSFRIVEAADYVRSFASDRSHMRGPDGRFRKPPPPWDPIGTGPPNLFSFVDMERPFLRPVLTFTEMLAACDAHDDGAKN